MARFFVCVLAATCTLGSLPPRSSAKAQTNQASPTPRTQVVSGVYRNSTFGFSYKPPYAWVERTNEMQGDDSGSQPKDRQAQVLLAVFERPPEALGDTVNSAVVIASESQKSYPGLKSAVDYFSPLEEVTKANGFQVTNQPYEFSIGTKKIAREDFSKNLGQLAMRQSTLVMLEKGSLISFTFIGGSDDEVENLIEGLNFSPVPARTGVSSSRRKK